MARYIDVEGYRKLFDEEYKKTRKLISEGETHLDNLAEGFSEASRVIDRMPTADVVPKSEVDRLELTLQGVMWSVDKWLDEADYDADPVKRAITMREKTLRIIENAKSEVAIDVLDEAIRAVYSKIDLKIYNTIEGKPLGDGVAFGKQQAMYDVITLLSELKKKYTEEKK